MKGLFPGCYIFHKYAIFMEYITLLPSSQGSWLILRDSQQSWHKASLQSSSASLPLTEMPLQTRAELQIAQSSVTLKDVYGVILHSLSSPDPLMCPSTQLFTNFKQSKPVFALPRGGASTLWSGPFVNSKLLCSLTLPPALLLEMGSEPITTAWVPTCW